MLRFNLETLAFDEGVGRSVGGVDEVDVAGVAARCVDGEDDEWVFENLRGAVDGALFEEDELAGADFEGRSFAEEELRSAGENGEIFVAGCVIVGGDWTVDTKDAGAGVGLVGRRVSISMVSALSGKLTAIFWMLKTAVLAGEACSV